MNEQMDRVSALRKKLAVLRDRAWTAEDWDEVDRLQERIRACSSRIAELIDKCLARYSHEQTRSDAS